MKSICLIPTGEAPEWMQILLGEIDTNIAKKLSKEDRKYVELREEMDQLLHKHPAVMELLDGNDGSNLNAEEQDAFHEYMVIRSEMESKERELFYRYGHVHCYEYMKRIGAVR